MKKNLLIILIAIFAVTPVLMQAQKLSDAEMKKANNPLANMLGVNLQNYYVTKLTNAPADAYMNTTWLRYVQPFANGKFLLRASLPISTVSMGYDSLGIPQTTSGLGDANAFLSYNFISQADMTIGIGPLIQAPTSITTNSVSPHALGNEEWAAGVALVVFIAKSPKLQYGSLVTWQRTFNTKESSPHSKVSELFIFQPFAFFQLGKGTYLRGAPQWVFNLQNASFSMPMGLGIGKVFKVGTTVFNLFFEPQYTMASRGTQPQFQIFTALMMQFTTGKKDATPPK